MAGFKSQAKRKRELAKLDKRRVKDEKRALRKAERSQPTAVAATPATVVVAVPNPSGYRAVQTGAQPPATKPLTLAEAVQRWKTTKVGKTKR